jgi:hypothetical protein
MAINNSPSCNKDGVWQGYAVCIMCLRSSDRNKKQAPSREKVAERELSLCRWTDKPQSMSLWVKRLTQFSASLLWHLSSTNSESRKWGKVGNHCMYIRLVLRLFLEPWQNLETIQAHTQEDPRSQPHSHWAAGNLVCSLQTDPFRPDHRSSSFPLTSPYWCNCIRTYQTEFNYWT